MTNFEKHLQGNKEDYQLTEVNPAVWKGIKAAGLSKKQPIIRRMTYWRAAVAIVAILAGAYLFWPPPATPDLATDLLLEYGFESPQPQLIALAMADELAAMPVPPQYRQDYQAMMAAIKALDQRYASVLDELQKKSAAEFTERQALSYYRKKVDLMTQLIKDLTTLHNNEKSYPNDNADYSPTI